MGLGNREGCQREGKDMQRLRQSRTNLLRGENLGKMWRKVIIKETWRRTVMEAVGENSSCGGTSSEHLFLFPCGPGRFITARGKRLCAPPQAPWVLHLREKLDARSAGKVGAGPRFRHALGNGNSVGMGWICPQTAYPSPSGTDGCHSKLHWQQSRDPCFWRLAMCTSVGKVWDEVCGCFASSLLAQRGGGCQSLETVKVRLWP